MKVLVSSLTYPLPNGVTSSINESVDGLLQNNVSVEIVAPDYENGLSRPEHVTVSSSNLGNQVIKMFGIQGRKERNFGLTAKQEIEAIAEKFRPDVLWLHSTTYAPNAFERFAVASNLPLVVTYHTMIDVYAKQYAGKLGELAMRARSKDVCNLADQVITPSNFIKERLLSFGVEKPINVIPTGIVPSNHPYSREELRKKFSLPINSKVLLFVGRVVKEKNVEFLIKNMQIIARHNPEAVLLFIGPGDIDAMKQLKDKFNLGEKVVFAGQLPLAETQRCYAGADVFVFASQSETQGLVIGEAMMNNLPVVALESPIAPEVYPDGTAFTANNATGFNQLVINVLKEKPEQVIATAREFVEREFSKKQMTEKQLNVLRAAIGVAVKIGG
ncbi:glycosyltransferase [Candidatus Berkelbacteria bacterium]|nr:glycosyltransferase [Candidatus Berkelbacteria bacterium]